jgi:hypothetical protein
MLASVPTPVVDRLPGTVEPEYQREQLMLKPGKQMRYAPKRPRRPLWPRIKTWLYLYFTPSGYAERRYERLRKKQQRIEMTARNTMVEQIRNRWKEPW